MLASKVDALKPLIQSRKGQHLTAYIANVGSVFRLRDQIREVLKEASEYLKPVMKPEDMESFLLPIKNAANDIQLLKKLNGNVGIFRNQRIFRILSMPVDLEDICVVATSFHIKPVLRWMQSDQEFLMLGLTEGAATLYHGSQKSFQKIDTILFSEQTLEGSLNGSYSSLKIKRDRLLKYPKYIDWLDHWISAITKRTKPALYLAGQDDLTKMFRRLSVYRNIEKRIVFGEFTENHAANICSSIRSQLKDEERATLKRALIEYYEAEEQNLARKNIFQVAKFAVRGRVKKLIVADEIQIFGKLDLKSGGLAIHPTHLDHEDDDLLDDIAQVVLAKGGEVIVAPRGEIPKGRPLLAILEPPESYQSKQFSLNSSSESEQERSAL